MDTRTSFVYDPLRQGYDTGLWKTLAGTPVAAEYIFVDSDSSTEQWDDVFDGLTLSEAVTVTRT